MIQLRLNRQPKSLRHQAESFAVHALTQTAVADLTAIALRWHRGGRIVCEIIETSDSKAKQTLKVLSQNCPSRMAGA